MKFELLNMYILVILWGLPHCLSFHFRFVVQFSLHMSLFAPLVFPFHFHLSICPLQSKVSLHGHHQCLDCFKSIVSNSANQFDSCFCQEYNIASPAMTGNKPSTAECIEETSGITENVMFIEYCIFHEETRKSVLIVFYILQSKLLTVSI